MPTPGADSFRAIRPVGVALLLLAAPVLFLLLRGAGGLSAVTYAEAPSGTLVPLDRRIDPEIDFPTSHILCSPLYQHWDVAALGVPAVLPPFDIRWTGYLHAAAGGEYRLLVQAAGGVRLLVDGRPVMPEPGREAEGARILLDGGWHAVDLTYRRGDEDPQIRFLWRTPGGPLETVPAGSLAPSREAIGWRFPRRVLGLLGLAGWLGLVFRIVRARRRPGTLGAYVHEHRHGVALAGILLAGFLLRWYQYDLIPFHHETADEYQHGWEGWTLLHEGKPAAWTFYPRYYPPAAITSFQWFGDPYHLARPYFDHPPGYSILIGATASLLGAREMLGCTLERMRPLPILLGVVTIFLIARVGWRFLPHPLAGTLAAAIYATLPVVVLGNRLVKAESLIGVLLLAQLLALDRYRRSGANRDLLWVAAGIVAGIWAKATGVALAAVAILVLGAGGRWKGAAVATAAAAGAILAYLVYGAFFGWDLFTRVLSLQSAKLVAVRSILDLAGISRIVELQFGSGWIWWLLIAAAVLALGEQRRILVPAAVYFVLLAATADVRGVFGWYRLPLYPFLCLAGGQYLLDWWRERDLGRGFLFAATALATTASLALPAAAERSRPAVAIVFAVACLPALWHLVAPSARAERARSLAVALSVGLFLAGNVAVVLRQVPIYLQEGVRGKAPAAAMPAGNSRRFRPGDQAPAIRAAWRSAAATSAGVGASQ